MTEVKLGIVLWFDAKKGYGFIGQDNEPDLFVHFSDVNSEGFKTLYKDQKVEYEVGLNKRNQPKAIHVNVVK
jgi:CspA family cold shock protein